jgi:peptidoglycan/LPS O-acetylase OafA/YrhL
VLIMTRSKVEGTVRVVVTLALGLIGAAAGFSHTHQAAFDSGQHGWLAWADAVVIELMALVAALKVRSTRGHSWFPLVVMVGAFVAQMAAQVAEAPHTVAGWLFAATPALGFLIVVKLVLMGREGPDQPQPAEVPLPARSDVQAPEFPSVPAQATRTDEPVAIEPPKPPIPASSTAPTRSTWPPART